MEATKPLAGLAIACALALAACTTSAHAQLLQPPPLRPDALIRAVNSDASMILPLFDFSRMTSSALGRNWRLASPAQQAALVGEFKTLLVRTYSAALSNYRGQQVEYRALRAAAGDTEVLVRSFVRRSGAEPITIDYEMHDGVAGWKIMDVRIAGISLVLNYRDTFAAVVRNVGIDGLIDSLADKNRQNAAAKGADTQLAPMLLIYLSGWRSQKE
jgi:phospholipid transport system substrate-binding protein